MSNLINACANRNTIRWKLLTGSSVLALTAYISSSDVTKAEVNDPPQIWIELDGQFANQITDEELFAPSFLTASPFDAASHMGLEKGRPTIWDKGAKLSFQPVGSDWVVSLGVRYGKSGRSETLNHLTTQPSHTNFGVFNAYQRFETQSVESHAILDFQAGKDVGLGRFGSSVIGAGVRIAQFNSRTHVVIHSQPTNYNGSLPYNKFNASFAAKRRFSGVGPSLSWNASANLAGAPSSGSITLDWGVNGALLFGRQRTAMNQQTSKAYFFYFTKTKLIQHLGSASRSKNVTVSNLGGFAAVSWRYADAKVSLGYRADMFFGAIDGGIDTRKSENRGFYGPFASISVGLP
ncbi:MAG TPA: hypothetical protein VGT78_02895 [Rhizomicrobium sp.]|nr:hypothetical protein [Rhizomicrobium sp.]